MRFLIAIIFLGSTGLALADSWETIPNCRLVPNASNDGDSFHVRAAGKERIFRLYFVDTPETSNDYRSRTGTQSRTLGVSNSRLLDLGHEATQFSESKLQGNFTIRTRWEDAKGASRLPRHFAVIETPEGDLAELLVAAGLVRIHGHYIDHPRGIPAARYRDLLERLERSAKSRQLGAWSGSTNPTEDVTNARRRSADPAEKDERSSLNDIPAF